jgi:uncharacterized protein
MPGLAGVTIGVRRLHLAPYLATPAIVVRRGPHEILTSDYHRWGEDLAEGINRAVARTSARRRSSGRWMWRRGRSAPATTTWSSSTSRASKACFRPAPRWATVGGLGEVHVVASWEIIRQQDETVLARGTTDFRQAGWRWETTPRWWHCWIGDWGAGA